MGGGDECAAMRRQASPEASRGGFEKSSTTGERWGAARQRVVGVGERGLCGVSTWATRSPPGRGCRSSPPSIPSEVALAALHARSRLPQTDTVAVRGRVGGTAAARALRHAPVAPLPRHPTPDRPRSSRLHFRSWRKFPSAGNGAQRSGTAVAARDSLHPRFRLLLPVLEPPLTHSSRHSRQAISGWPSHGLVDCRSDEAHERARERVWENGEL